MNRKLSDFFHSCCVTVKNIERDIFILPREKVNQFVISQINTKMIVIFIIKKSKRITLHWNLEGNSK